MLPILAVAYPFIVTFISMSWNWKLHIHEIPVVPFVNSFMYFLILYILSITCILLDKILRVSFTHRTAVQKNSWFSVNPEKWIIVQVPT